MPEAGDQPAKPLRTWRPMVLWTVGILLVLGLAWFVGAVVVPFLQVRAAVRANDAHRLGSPRQAVSKVNVYLNVSRLFTRERKHRSKAVELLGKAGGKDAISTLSELLKDPDASVRAVAAEALGSIGPEAREAIPAVAKLLKDPSVHVRFSAAWAVCKISQSSPEAREAIRVLAGMLKNADESVRMFAARALGRIGPAAHEASSALAASLKDESPYVRLFAAHALRCIGPGASAATPALIESLRNPPDSDSELRTRVAVAVAGALGAIGPDAREAIPALQAVLKEKDNSEVYQAAKYALERIRAGEAGEPR